MLWRMTGGDAERRELLDDVERMVAGDADALFNVANTLGVSADLAREIMYRLAGDAGVDEAWLNLGLLLSEGGRGGEALDCYRTAYDKGDHAAAIMLGQGYEDLGRLTEAKDWYEKVKRHPFAPLRLSRVVRALGDEEEADRILLESARDAQEAAVEVVLRGLVSATEAQVLLEEHWSRGELEVAVPLANIYEGLGRIAEATSVLRAGLASGDRHVRHNLGCLLWEHGDRGEALFWWRRAAEAGDEKAARALSEVESERRWRHAAIVGSLSVGVVLTRLVAGRLRSPRIG